MARPKKVLVEKVAEETKVPANDLERLPVEALEKLDDLVLDETNADGNTDDAYVGGKRLMGYHPITKEPVYI